MASWIHAAQAGRTLVRAVPRTNLRTWASTLERRQTCGKGGGSRTERRIARAPFTALAELQNKAEDIGGLSNVQNTRTIDSIPHILSLTSLFFSFVLRAASPGRLRAPPVQPRPSGRRRLATRSAGMGISYVPFFPLGRLTRRSSPTIISDVREQLGATPICRWR